MEAFRLGREGKKSSRARAESEKIMRQKPGVFTKTRKRGKKPTGQRPHPKKNVKGDKKGRINGRDR